MLFRSINRLLSVDMILKRAMKGRLNLMGAALEVQKELMSIPEFGNEETTGFFAEFKAIAGFKKAILMTTGAAVQKLMTKIEDEQEILMHVADMVIQTFSSESALLRAARLVEMKGEEAAQLEADMMRVYLHDAADRIHKHGKDAIYTFASGDELRMLLLGLKRFTKTPGFNSKEA